MQGDEQKCLDAGMDAFLAKPFGLDSLGAVLARWLAQAPAGLSTYMPKQPLAPVSNAQEAINIGVLDTLRELDEAGGPGLAKDLFQAFLASAEAGMAQVQAATRDGNARALGQAAHALKSSAANVGAHSLSACYRQLEIVGREGRIDEARAMFELVRHEHERAVLEIHDLLLELP
jgi:HPt (histidine-containing phosphotransfer) domain-containing protein